LAVSVKPLKPGIPRNPLLSILLGITAFFVPDPAFSEPPWASDTGNPNMAGRGTIIESPCAKLTPPCNMLCQEAWLEESRAEALEEAAEAVRSKADMAKKRVVYFENLAEKRDLEARRSGGNRSRFLWKGVNSLLRLLVPRDSRNNSRYSGKATQSNSFGSKKQKEKIAGQAWERADEARATADEAVREAYEAARKAVTARAAADAARSSYEECICR
jgi:hypothetical protein